MITWAKHSTPIYSLENPCRQYVDICAFPEGVYGHSNRSTWKSEMRALVYSQRDLAHPVLVIFGAFKTALLSKQIRFNSLMGMFLVQYSFMCYLRN